MWVRLLLVLQAAVCPSKAHLYANKATFVAIGTTAALAPEGERREVLFLLFIYSPAGKEEGREERIELGASDSGGGVVRPSAFVRPRPLRDSSPWLHRLSLSLRSVFRARRLSLLSYFACVSVLSLKNFFLSRGEGGKCIFGALRLTSPSVGGL